MYIRYLIYAHLTPIFRLHNIFSHKYKWILCTENGSIKFLMCNKTYDEIADIIIYYFDLGQHPRKQMFCIILHSYDQWNWKRNYMKLIFKLKNFLIKCSTKSYLWSWSKATNKWIRGRQERVLFINKTKITFVYRKALIIEFNTSFLTTK